METFKGNIKFLSESVLYFPQGKRRRRGKVSLCMEKSFDPRGNLVEEKFRRRKHINRIKYIYDDKGQCVERYEFTFDHVLFFRYKYRYDQWGHQVEEECFNPDGTLSHSFRRRYNRRGEEVEYRTRRGESHECVHYKYDESGNVVEESTSQNGKVCQKRNFLYDNHGNKISDQSSYPNLTSQGVEWENIYSPEGLILRQTVRASDTKELKADYQFEYNAQGRRICTKYHNDEGFFSVNRIIFNPKGNKTKERWFSKTEYDNTPSLGTHNFIYDSQDRLIEETTYRGVMHHAIGDLLESEEGIAIQSFFRGEASILTYRATYTYALSSQPNEILEEHFDLQGTLIQENFRSFDTQGNLLLERQISFQEGEKKESSISYQYDHCGNWTTKESTVNGVLSEVVQREITYWE